MSKASESAKSELARSPGEPAAVYLGAVKARAGLGDRLGARALGVAALEQEPGAAELRGAVADLYAEDGLLSVALELGQVQTLAAAMSRPAFATRLSRLAESVAAAERNDPDAALEAYQRFLATYGAPDHPRLREWAWSALAPSAALGQRALEEANRAPDPADKVGWLTVAWQLGDSAGRTLAQPLFAEVVRSHPPWSCPRTPWRGRARRSTPSGATRAVAAAPGWADPRFNLAVLLRRAGASTEADRELSIAQALALAVAAAVAACTVSGEDAGEDAGLDAGPWSACVGTTSSYESCSQYCAFIGKTCRNECPPQARLGCPTRARRPGSLGRPA